MVCFCVINITPTNTIIGHPHQCHLTIYFALRSCLSTNKSSSTRWIHYCIASNLTNVRIISPHCTAYLILLFCCAPFHFAPLLSRPWFAAAACHACWYISFFFYPSDEGKKTASLSFYTIDIAFQTNFEWHTKHDNWKVKISTKLNLEKNTENQKKNPSDCWNKI